MRVYPLVGSFLPSGYGLNDMAVNVWGWTCDCFVSRHADEVVNASCGPAVNPRVVSPDKSHDAAQAQFGIPREVVKDAPARAQVLQLP
jgi:formylglycine-generating enzyme required for sulfatase activity